MDKALYAAACSSLIWMKNEQIQTQVVKISFLYLGSVSYLKKLAVVLEVVSSFKTV